MNSMILYHVSTDTTIGLQETLGLGTIFKACIDLRIFIVGYNVLEVTNGSDRVLLALLLKSEDIVEEFENLTHLKLVKVERE